MYLGQSDKNDSAIENLVSPRLRQIILGMTRFG